ncbi:MULTISPECIES: WXG100 family type VII secretion target [unclassified Enterococcus]|uniref:WXG100 family type VII secretion target n=1 Tax=unclassified Enterococcus TaxID=2608891 RepID=UPI001554E569|nr:MULTISPECIES: WXG100 family type VII secretion target [unclassified Enterococcus]MBS7576551.1 WXG100 family type VII secretion target [Enterococcus sp. MMGLQ5-2]MBS7583962.1 WXG100 family type VII secretion target [Enterococcus sp. MMGLQ5-1]NPD11823.1 hypothetical protein [Enterococcus sp. MMGLQ5-1]NPD36388.1 hypothetical protein [Enterococcus sp. MMGLQ5-2]
MLINVEPQQLILQAEKVKQYQQHYLQNFDRINSDIERLTIFWQGAEATEFIGAWQSLRASSSAILHFSQALIKYAEQLNRVGSLYLEAQEKAQYSAKRL